MGVQNWSCFITSFICLLNTDLCVEDLLWAGTIPSAKNTKVYLLQYLVHMRGTV